MPCVAPSIQIAPSDSEPSTHRPVRRPRKISITRIATAANATPLAIGPSRCNAWVMSLAIGT